jgi:ribosomal protein L37E
MSDNAMPLSALVKTHERCVKCGVMFPQKFLSCPACIGFTKKHEGWSVPGKPKAKRKPVQEQSFFDDSQEYPI